jgi:hypothetical protein
MAYQSQCTALPTDVQAFEQRWIACTTWEKTSGNLTFYKVKETCLIRSKSSLTAKRVLTDKAFARTRYNAGILKQASQIVSPIYKALTDDWRCHDLYLKLVGMAAQWLHTGMDKGDVPEKVQEALYALGYRKEWPVWELPPNLAAWVKRERTSEQVQGSGHCLKKAKKITKKLFLKPNRYDHTRSAWQVDKTGCLKLFRLSFADTG